MKAVLCRKNHLALLPLKAARFLRSSFQALHRPRSQVSHILPQLAPAKRLHPPKKHPAKAILRRFRAKSILLLNNRAKLPPLRNNQANRSFHRRNPANHLRPNNPSNRLPTINRASLPPRIFRARLPLLNHQASKPLLRNGPVSPLHPNNRAKNSSPPQNLQARFTPPNNPASKLPLRKSGVNLRQKNRSPLAPSMTRKRIRSKTSMPTICPIFTPPLNRQ